MDQLFLSGFIGSLGVLLLGFTLTKYLVLAFSAPFMSPVSERIDRHLNPGHAMNPSSSFWGLLSRSLRLNIGNLFRELGLTLMLLILSLFPVIGLISAPLIFVVQAFYAGFGNLDYTLERYYDYRSSKSFLHQYRGLAIGNGLVFILISLIPVLGIILVLPLSVSAGTFTVLEKSSQETSRTRKITGTPIPTILNHEIHQKNSNRYCPDHPGACRDHICHQYRLSA